MSQKSYKKILTSVTGRLVPSISSQTNKMIIDVLKLMFSSYYNINKTS